MAEVDYTLEKWLPVVGYERLYEVSDLGRVRSLPRKVPSGHTSLSKPRFYTVRGKILSATPSNGYLVNVLHKDGIPWSTSIHRLVAVAFVPNPLGHPQVNHIDGDRKNNLAANLEWCDAQGNADNAVQRGVVKRGEAHYRAALTDEAVIAIRASYEKQSVLAEKYGVTNGLISMVRTGKIWRHVEQDPLRPANRTKRYPTGEDARGAKLTEDDVRDIRASAEMVKVLAARYGVSMVLISKIRLGDIWRHVLPCPERTTPKKTRRRRPHD